MTKTLTAGFILISSAACFGQTPNDPAPYTPTPKPGCDDYTLQTMPELGFYRKACIYRDSLLTGSALFGSAFFAGAAQLMHNPAGWPQGAGGYGRRFGSRYAQGMVKSTAGFLVGALNREDPRASPPANPACGSPRPQPTAILPRTGAALLRVVWTHRDNCSGTIAFSNFAGSLSSGFIGMAYYPPAQNTVSQAFVRSGTAFGGVIGASLFNEFQGDIFGLFGKMFGSGKPKK